MKFQLCLRRIHLQTLPGVMEFLNAGRVSRGFCSLLLIDCHGVQADIKYGSLAEGTVGHNQLDAGGTRAVPRGPLAIPRASFRPNNS